MSTDWENECLLAYLISILSFKLLTYLNVPSLLFRFSEFWTHISGSVKSISVTHFPAFFCFLCILLKKFIIIIFFYLRECASRGGQRGRERILSRLHAQFRAQYRAWSHDPGIGTWAEIKRQRLKQLRHPSAPFSGSLHPCWIDILLNLGLGPWEHLCIHQRV